MDAVFLASTVWTKLIFKLGSLVFPFQNLVCHKAVIFLPCRKSKTEILKFRNAGVIVVIGTKEKFKENLNMNTKTQFFWFYL